MAATYQVTLYDTPSGDVLTILTLGGDRTAITNLRYERVLNSIGVFQLTLPLTDPTAELFAVMDRLVEVTRFPTPATPTCEETFLTRFVKRFIDEQDQGWLVIGGFNLNHLLARRVIYPEDDPLVAGGYSTKSGEATAVIAELVDEQAGPSASAARQTENLYSVQALGGGLTVGGRWRYENLFEVLREVADSGGVDFWVERTTAANFRFSSGVYGDDLTKTTNFPGAPFVVFSPEMGTMVEAALMDDRRDEATYLYLLGQGPEEDRDVYAASSSYIGDTAYNRIEVAEDARTVEDGDATQYLTQATSLLNERLPRAEFSFELSPSALSAYRELWDLGDKVTVVFGDYEADYRVMAVEVELTADGERINPTVELVE